MDFNTAIIIAVTFFSATAIGLGLFYAGFLLGEREGKQQRKITRYEDIWE